MGLACALFLLSGCSDRRQTVERPPLQVGTIVATPISTYRWAETFGQTEGVEEVEVRSQVGGVLRALHFKEGEWVKAGDTLFEESIGRTDLPGGSHTDLIRSIQKRLMPLPDETKVMCGHGPATTIGHERHYNPFIVK